MEIKKINPIIDQLFKGIDTMIDTKKVVGEAQVLGDMTIIPLVEMSFALGAGAFDEGIVKKNNQRGAMGAKVKPTAVLVISKEGYARVIHVGSGSAFEKLIDLAPELLNKIKKGGKASKEEKEEIINKAFN